MISVTPEVIELGFTWAGVMDAHTEAGIRISLWWSGFVVAAAPKGCLQVVLFNPTGDGAGVETDMLGFYDTRGDERLRQLYTDLLEQSVRGIGEESAESLERRRLLIGVESECGHDGRIFHQMGMEFSEKAHASKPLVDTGLEQRLTIGALTSGLVWKFGPGR